jgi:signal transduction histidine kinase
VDKSGAYVSSKQFCDADLSSGEDRDSKDEVWYEHALCNAFSDLSADFFRRPPYLHLSGHSYIMLALSSDMDRYGKLDWLSSHKAYMHVSELNAVARLGVKLTREEALVASLNDNGLRALANETELLLTDQYLLVRASSGSQAAETSYRVYNLDDWRLFLEATPWIATVHHLGDMCLSVVGSVCFGINPKGVQRRLDQASALAASALLLVLMAVFVLLLQRQRLRRREQDARLFVLQTLSHEIRTPTTSLLLSLEPIRRAFDELPEQVQPAFLRICDNVQRLQRVVEASKQYLRGQLSERELQFNKVLLSDMHAYLDSITESYDHKIEVTSSIGAVSVRIDPYWVGVCIRNLVDNALAHGAQPIVLQLSCHGNTLALTVQDEGNGSELIFAQMISPFARGQNSEGLGFGLAVVNRLLKAMGGRLRYQAKPTRFTIELVDCVQR